jgi:hypothetical protein
MIRDTARTRDLVAYLREHGVLVTGLTYPVVPRGDEEIRAQVNADHTEEDIDRVLEMLDIWVAQAAVAADGFHARYDAVARGYIYRLGTADVSRSPFLRQRCWPLGEPLELATLNDAAAASLAATRSAPLQKPASRSAVRCAPCTLRPGGAGNRSGWSVSCGCEPVSAPHGALHGGHARRCRTRPASRFRDR